MHLTDVKKRVLMGIPKLMKMSVVSVLKRMSMEIFVMPVLMKMTVL